MKDEVRSGESRRCPHRPRIRETDSEAASGAIASSRVSVRGST